MGRYGRIAVTAVDHAAAGLDPRAAWRDAAAAEYPDNPSAREKSCPRGAFLGLAEDGLIIGVAPGSYLRSRTNKDYAVEAVEVLHGDPTLSRCPADLWEAVMAGRSTRHNEQMHVVCALWNAGLVKRS